MNTEKIILCNCGSAVKVSTSKQICKEIGVDSIICDVCESELSTEIDQKVFHCGETETIAHRETYDICIECIKKDLRMYHV